MWKHMARIIGEIRPQYAFVENSPLLVGRGLATVLADLAEMGYDAKWCVLGAVDAGAPHRRDRIWIIATDSAQLQCDGINDNTGKLLESQSISKLGNNSWQNNVSNSNLRGCDDGRDIERQYETDNTQIGAAQKDNQSGNIGQHWTSEDDCDVAHTTIERQPRQGQHWFGSDPAEAREGETDHAFAERVGHIWGIESPLGRVAHGVAARVDRLKAIGNGQVPAVAALAWKTLINGIDP